MCGTCRYCLGFFQVAAFFSVFLLLDMIAIRFLYGGMPPTYAMTVGFWIHYVVGWLAIYLSIYVVRVVGKGLFTKWTPKYCFSLMIIIIILYAAASICFFVPVTKERMMHYSSDYIRQSQNRTPPPFLDKLQEQFECCGIQDYLDYNDPDRLGTKDILTENLTEVLDPSSDLWYLGEYAYTQHGIIHENSHRTRTLYYFNVPRSCCKYSNRVINKDCGDRVEFGYDKIRNKASAMQKINTIDPQGGCYFKYQSIMSQKNNFQLNWLIGFQRWGTLMQAIIYFLLIWVFRLALKGMRRDFETAKRLSLDEDDEEEIEILPLEFQHGAGISSPPKHSKVSTTESVMRLTTLQTETPLPVTPPKNSQPNRKSAKVSSSSKKGNPIGSPSKKSTSSPVPSNVQKSRK